MLVADTSLPAVKTVLPRRFADNRGFFSEVWNTRALAGAGIDVRFVQENHSFSRQAGTVRGLHFQGPPQAQAKLVRVGRGEVLDVAVDVRRGSPTFGQHTKVRLSAENGLQLYVPEGFLHGFMTLSDDVDLYYLVSSYWSPECEGIVQWNDPSLGIDWGIDASRVLLSKKDAEAPPFGDFKSPF